MRAGILTRFTLRSIARNRARTVVAVVGIALSCALITGILTTAITMNEGMLHAEVESNGSYEVEFFGLSEQGAKKVEDDPHTEGTAVVEEYGSSLFSDANSINYYGPYLGFVSLPRKGCESGLLPRPKLSSGRKPKTSEEVILPDSMLGETYTGAEDETSSDGALAIGSKITVHLGTRVSDDGGGTYQDTDPYEYDDAGRPNEHLESTGAARTFTVVGFYEMDATWYSGAGMLAITAADDNIEPRSIDVYARMKDVTTSTGVDRYLSLHTNGDALADPDPADCAEGEDGAIGTITNDYLLGLEGISEEGPLANSLAQIAAVLLVVVAVAAILLVYNAFAISVSERTRQFGLLSSLGASRRQLKRTIYAEALLLGAMGIPFGMVLGIAGTWGVFAVLGEGIAAIAGYETATDAIVVSPGALGGAAALSVASIALSAYLPAWRAGRVSAVDSIRQTQDVRVSRIERLRRHRMKSSGRAPLSERLRLRVEGLSGLLAHRNLTRSSARGRAAVLSLGISVALLITSGIFAVYTDELNSSAEISTQEDFTVNLGIRPGAGTAAEQSAAIDEAVAQLGSGADIMGTSYYTDTLLTGESQVAQIAADDDSNGAMKNGYHGFFEIFFVDDATWQSFVADVVGSGRMDEFADASTPRAIGINGIAITDDEDSGGEVTHTYNPFAGTGTATLYTKVQASDGTGSFDGIELDDEGELAAHYEGDGGLVEEYDENGELISSTDTTSSTTLPLADAVEQTYDLEIGAVSDSAPALISGMVEGSETPTLVLPFSALATIAESVEQDGENEAGASTGSDLISIYADPFGFASTDSDSLMQLWASVTVDALDGKEAEAEKEIETVLDSLNNLMFQDTGVYNAFASSRTDRLMAAAVRTLAGAFAGVTTAIAVANVFNTISTSIILRRREFAVLRSIGMDTRTFRRMLVRECASYAARGIALGFLFAAAVILYLGWGGWEYLVISRSALLALAGWAALAVALVLVVLAASTVYALRRSRGSSIVESLREDAI